MTTQDFLTMTPEIAFKHAKWLNVNKQPFTEGESIIATDAKYSYWYAKYVLRGPFKLGEPVIYNDPKIAGLYQAEVLDRDFAKEDQDHQAFLFHFGLM
jgi:hypothetical protein